ncbi:hypothetical protein [Jiella pelagia]|uniref:Uncharacterized protein n=1 Tax=Jiella pelagia TaxID=2986949 RepID=A0ABY7C0K1_9HYPH|nr:hypothetical protein [Jiella pelagia]WAP69296.1 hypothetical protein OH818_03075 [Jiella pelagia]
MKRPTNDNAGLVFGSDPHGDLFEKWRIADAAKVIEADLDVHLGSEGGNLGRITSKGEAYSQGLTNAEAMLAVITALAATQQKFVNKLASLHFDVGGDDE